MKNCIVCNKLIKGRSDKKFCAITCKNDYHKMNKKQKDTTVQQIDNILHNNHTILKLLTTSAKSKKIKIPKLILDRAGFNFGYFTGIYLNTKGKTYHYVYDFAWMKFSDQEVLIVKKD